MIIVYKITTMTIDNINTLIVADESRTLELKKTTGELKDGMHTALYHIQISEPTRLGMISYAV